MKCSKRNKAGDQCGAQAVGGTDACIRHSGRPIAEHRAKGNVIMELRRWGLQGEELRDPGVTLLQLMTQSAVRVELYSSLLSQAYEAAERLAVTQDTAGVDPPALDNAADRQRAAEDLQRVFSTGGVAALIGVKWGSTSGEFSNLDQVEEGIRGLVRLEAEERDRCAVMATKAIAAGLAERQVRLAEQQGQLVAEAIRAMLTDLGHDPADPQVARVVSTRLHALAGGAA